MAGRRSIADLARPWGGWLRCGRWWGGRVGRIVLLCGPVRCPGRPPARAVWASRSGCERTPGSATHGAGCGRPSPALTVLSAGSTPTGRWRCNRSRSRQVRRVGRRTVCRRGRCLPEIYLEAWLIAHGLKCCSASRTVSLTSESGRPDHLEWGRDFADWPPVVNDESNDFHELVPHVGPSK